MTVIAQIYAPEFKKAMNLKRRKITDLLPELACLLQGSAQAWCLLIFSFAIWSGIKSPLGVRVSIIAAALAVFFFFIVRRYGGKKNPFDARTWTRAGWFLLAFFSVFTFVWAYSYDSIQNSDFGLYYRCGVSLRDALPKWISNCQSNYFYIPDKVYWTRSLIYSAPFGALFGDNYSLFKLYNAGLHVLTMALLFFGLKAYRGPRVATIALLLFGLYPEWLYSVTVATPDNLALFFVIAFLLLLPKLSASRLAIIPIVLIAITMFAANLSRTIGPFLVLTLVLWMLATIRREHWKRPLCSVVAVIGLYGLENSLFSHLIHSSARDQFELLSRVSTVDLNEPLQSIRFVFGWIDQFLPTVPAADRTRIVIEKIILELSQGFAHYPAYLYEKTNLLFQGNGYYSFSSGYSGPNPDTAMTVSTPSVPTSESMPALLWAIALFQILLSSFALLRARRNPLSSACVFFMTIFFLVIIGLGDTQQRYSLLISPTIAIMAAIALFPEDETNPAAGDQSIPIKWTIYGVSLLLLVYLGGAIAAAKIAMRIPKPLMHARQMEEKQIEGRSCNSEKLELAANYKRLRATAQPDATCFSIWIPLPAGTRSLSFFVSRDDFPFPFEGKTDSPYRYRIEHQGDILFDGTLGKKTVQWHRFNLNDGQENMPGNQDGITLIAFKDSPGQAEAFNVWLMSTHGKPLK